MQSMQNGRRSESVMQKLDLENDSMQDYLSFETTRHDL